MRPDDLHEFTRRRQFVPFRIHSTDGEVYEIRHPDRAIPLRSRVVIGVGGDDTTPDRVEHLALIHVARLEEIVNDPKRQAG